MYYFTCLTAQSPKQNDPLSLLRQIFENFYSDIMEKCVNLSRICLFLDLSEAVRPNKHENRSWLYCSSWKTLFMVRYISLARCLILQCDFRSAIVAQDQCQNLWTNVPFQQSSSSRRLTELATESFETDLWSSSFTYLGKMRDYVTNSIAFRLILRYLTEHAGKPIMVVLEQLATVVYGQIY